MKIKESIPLNKLKITSDNINSGFTYQSSSYYYVKLAFQNLPVNYRESSLIDFGSGKGAVLIMLQNLGFKKMLGIEFAKELVIISENNIEQKVNKNINTLIEVICYDAALFEIPDIYNIFFFYNPFSRIVFEKVLMNIERSLEKSKRKIFIIYINAVIDVDMFRNFNYELLFEHRSKKKSEILIFSK